MPRPAAAIGRRVGEPGAKVETSGRALGSSCGDVGSAIGLPRAGRGLSRASARSIPQAGRTWARRWAPLGRARPRWAAGRVKGPFALAKQAFWLYNGG